MADQSKVDNVLSGKKAVVVAMIAVATLLATAIIIRNATRDRDTQIATAQQTIPNTKRAIQAVDDISSEFSRLQELDDNYSVMLGTPGIDLDSADKEILKGEAAFIRALNDMEKRAQLLSDTDKSVITKLLANFRMAVNNRKYLTSVRQRFSGNKLLVSPGSDEMLQLKSALIQKDRQLMMAERNEVSRNVNRKTNLADSLEMLLNEEEARNTGLLDAINNLKSENSSLRTQMTQINNRQQSTIDITRYRELEQQVNELSAELYLAKVDCSLVRADADKIISTSRQRKELLTDALQVLKNLSESGSASIRQKAFEKLGYLEQVSEKIRE